MIAPDYLLFTNLDLTKRIYYNLSSRDLDNCALVNKVWHAAVQDARQHRTIKISGPIVRQIYSGKSNLETYITDNYKWAPNIVVHGWVPKSPVPEQTYDQLLKANWLKARNLTLKCRGEWLGCKCPRKGSSCGEQIDSIKEDEITAFETILVAPTFKISACALLDLVSRSPRLKVLRFFGVLDKCEHNQLFELKRFLSDLDCLMWPNLDKSHVPTLTTLVKRNENITAFHCNGEMTCDLMATDSLNNLRYLALTLKEKWIDDDPAGGNIKKYIKRAQRFTNKIRSLGMGKKIEALEVRTFKIPFDEDEDKPSDLKLALDPLHEQYIKTFWEQVCKLPRLKYLSVHGAWELNEVCRELAKHDSKIEFLRISLLPASLQQSVDNQEDSPTLSMADEARNLKKLPKLKSLWLTCFDKVGSIDEKTSNVLKELVDLLWTIDIKVMFTDEVESLLSHIMRRGNQLGKTYKVLLHIQCKEPEKSNILTELNLKFSPVGSGLRDGLALIADAEVTKRNSYNQLASFQIWGLRQIDNTRDKTTFEKLRNTWAQYDGKFNLTSHWKTST